jgi:ABC-type transporter Mla subunit MlaD
MFQLLRHKKNNVTQKFFEEVAVQVRGAFERANRDAESWLKAIMAPLETQVREHQVQLKRRLESIKRIHQATDTLEDRIGDLAHVEQSLALQIASLESVGEEVRSILHSVIRTLDGLECTEVIAEARPEMSARIMGGKLRSIA